MFSVALFDFDGTLAQTDTLHLACWNRVLNRYEIRLTEDFYITYCVGVLSPKVAALIKQNYPMIEESVEEIANLKDQFFSDFIQTNRVPILPGVREILDLLKRNRFKLGIVSGLEESSISKILYDQQLDSYFQIISSRENIENGKPSPEGYLYALERFQVEGASAIAFEDTKSGVRAAKAAGIVTFAILQSQTRQHDLSSADFICRDLFEAIKVLSS